MKSWVRVALLVAALVLPLTACGKRGDLDPPAGADPAFPRQYPTKK